MAGDPHEASAEAARSGTNGRMTAPDGPFLRRLFLCTILSALAIGILWSTPNAAQAFPGTQACIGAPSDQPAATYSETRQFVDAQSWWTTTPGQSGTNFGHAHVGACIPERESLSGATFPLDIKLQLHDNPARPSSSVYPGLSIVLKGTDYEITNKQFAFLGWSCPVGTCVQWVHYDVPLAAFGHSGLQEVRFRFLVDEPDGNRMIANMNWQVTINNGKSVADVTRQPYLRGKGWYTGSGYCESAVRSVPLPDTPVAQPYSPIVSQVWHGEPTDLQVTGHTNRLDADFHAGIPGTTLADVPAAAATDAAAGAFGPAALTVPTLSSGTHKLLGRADCADPRGSTNAGVLVFPVQVA